MIYSTKLSNFTADKRSWLAEWERRAVEGSSVGLLQGEDAADKVTAAEWNRVQQPVAEH